MASINTDSAAGLPDASFDFLIVGGGTSGLVVANRLSEDLDVRVLVLEAGTNRVNDPRIQIPGLAATTYENPEFDRDFRSTPQVCTYTIINTSSRGLTRTNVRTGTAQWPHTPRDKRANARRILCDKPRYGRIPVTHGPVRLGGIRKPRMGLGQLRALRAQVPHRG
jgi:choline dehydrogenase-like flavoprotein